MEQVRWVKDQELVEEWAHVALVWAWDEASMVDMVSVAGDLSLPKTSYLL